MSDNSFRNQGPTNGAIETTMPRAKRLKTAISATTCVERRSQNLCCGLLLRRCLADTVSDTPVFLFPCRPKDPGGSREGVGDLGGPDPAACPAEDFGAAYERLFFL